MLKLDHITVIAGSLKEGVADIEAKLGVSIPAGGAHREMGTHNHLLRLGPDLFLEVIAIDPAAPLPARPRWFGLDDAPGKAAATPPCLSTWVVRTDDLDVALSSVPGAAGPAIPVSRGTLFWRISVPEDGSMPADGAFPTMIEWPAGPHPASRMPDLGCTLLRFEVEHPLGETIARDLGPFLSDERLAIRFGPEKRLTAHILTPHGHRML